MGNPGAPHRTSEPTALERWVQVGATPLVPVRELSLATIEISGAVAFIGVVALCFVVGRLLLFWLIIAFVVPRRLASTKKREYAEIARALNTEISSLPFPVHGFNEWLGQTSDQFGALEIRVAGSHTLAEAAVRAAEPRARVQWAEPGVMRVESDWQHDRSGLQRARRVFVEMFPLLHADCGIEYVNCAPAEPMPWSGLVG